MVSSNHSKVKRLFANEDDAKDLTWHANGRIFYGIVRHPADCLQWKKINGLYPNFGKSLEILDLD